MNNHLTVVDQLSRFLESHSIAASQIKENIKEGRLIELLGLNAFTHEEVEDIKESQLLKWNSELPDRIIQLIESEDISLTAILIEISNLLQNLTMEEPSLNATIQFDLIRGFLWTTKDGEQFKPSEMRTDLIFARLEYVLNPKKYKASPIMVEAAVTAFMLALKERALTPYQEKRLDRCKAEARKKFNLNALDNV